MKDFISSNYLRGFGSTDYEFSSNLARLRLNFPLIIARIEKHTIVKIQISYIPYLNNGSNEEKIGERKRKCFLSFYVSIDFLIS